MIVLGIETSCDETSVALLRDDGTILSNVVASQVEAHALYGGVVPEVAARAHLEALPGAFEEALRLAGVGLSDVGLVAATAGPGLIGALLVGLSAARALASARGVPFVAVNHLEGHLFSPWLRAGGSPALPVEDRFHGLVVSGGHAELVRVESGRVTPLARTRDDAPGEAFDKVARRAGLGYPGGPVVDRIAARGDGSRFPLPVGRAGDGSEDFSFSGLKTSMLREFERRGIDGSPLDPEALPAELVDLFASFQRAIVQALLSRVEAVHRRERIRCLALSGGVAANSELRASAARWGERENVPVRLPDRSLTTDNAAMIAWAGALRHRESGPTPPDEARAHSRWPLGRTPSAASPSLPPGR
ncbi:MAG: tRNA (adenosine(37)-N6)-threonylcarbamoyltransferase complex transferase subunit TsaD [Acidobacteriota bacterium]